MRSAPSATFRRWLYWRAMPPVFRLWIGTPVRRFVGKRSFAQEGEDLILASLLGAVQRGFYVDIGAHHPYRGSNTARLYELGWRGINVDAAPDSMAAFRMHRRRDVNLEVAVGTTDGRATMYLFEEPALNTLDADVAASLRQSGWQQLREVTIPVATLRGILERHLPPGGQVDFLNVDVEGRDLDVLRSNDWHRFRPSCVAVEAAARGVDSSLHSEAHRFLADTGYLLWSRTVTTSIYLAADRVDALIGPA